MAPPLKFARDWREWAVLLLWAAFAGAASVWAPSLELAAVLVGLSAFGAVVVLLAMEGPPWK